MIIDKKWLNEGGLGWPPNDAQQDCFYCGEPVSPPVIEWMGNHATIYLHPNCAVELTIRLLRDVHEFECKHLRGELLGAFGRTT